MRRPRPRRPSRQLAGHDWPGGVDVRVRVGIHAAEPLVSDNRYVGLGINRAARICELAHGGQVLLSQVAASLLADSDLQNTRLRDLGQYPLKDFAGPERLYQLEIDGLQSEFPPLRAKRPKPGLERALEFRILGPLEVLAEGRPLPLGGQKQRAVLALLLLEEGRVVRPTR